MALDIKKFIGRFVEEAKEHLGRLASGLAEIEQGAVSAEKINSLFRSVHTLKGSSRMLKLEPITQVSHSLEDLLSALREERVTVNPPVIALLYQGVDALSDQIQQLIAHGQVDALSSVNTQLCQQLTAIAEGDVLSVVAAEPAELKSSELKTHGSSNATAEPTLTASDTVRVKLDKLDELIKLMGELVTSHAGMRELAVTSLQLEQQLQQQLQGHLPVAMQQFSRNMRDIVLSQESLMQELHDKTLQMRMF